MGHLKFFVQRLIFETRKAAYSSNDEDDEVDFKTLQETTYEQFVVIEDTPAVLSFLFTMEKILNHGLKNVAIFGTTTQWDFLEKLEECIPGTKEFISLVKSYSKNSLGLQRAMKQQKF